MSSHELMKVRWRSWSWRAGEGNTRRVLASLCQSGIASVIALSLCPLGYNYHRVLYG